jgi:hypothetical protein
MAWKEEKQMLTDMLTGKMVVIPIGNERELDVVLANLTPAQVDAMEDELNRRADAIGNTIDDFTNSSWVPGTNWQGTVFQPLYDACQGYSASILLPRKPSSGLVRF